MNFPNSILIETEECIVHIKSKACEETGTYEALDIRVNLSENVEGDIDVYLFSKTSRVKCIKLRWSMPMPTQASFLGDAWERSYGDLAWQGMSGRRILPWYFFMKTDACISAYGVMVRPSAMCYWMVDNEGISLIMDTRNGGRGVNLLSRNLHLATMVFREYRDLSAFSAARQFCASLCKDPVFPSVAVYGSNNWYYAYGHSSEREILEDADYLASLSKGLENPPFMVIDDCWQEYRSEHYIGGPWKKGNHKFPDMARLSREIKARGLHTGIWIRFLQNKDSYIKDEWRLDTGILDPTIPEIREYIAKDIHRLGAEWGYELLKHDFSTYDLFGRWGFEMKPEISSGDWCFHDDTLTNAEVVKKLYTTIYEEAVKLNMTIIGCNTIGHLGAGLMHISRTGDDTSGKNWERTRTMGINTLAFRLMQHKTFFDVDADCVGITGEIPWFYNRQWADLIAKSGTALFLSIKPGVLNEEEERALSAILREASLGNGRYIPLDWENNDTPSIWISEDEGREVHYTWYREDDDFPRSKDEKYAVHLPRS